jgi:hypothetical protein
MSDAGRGAGRGGGSRASPDDAGVRRPEEAPAVARPMRLAAARSVHHIAGQRAGRRMD